MPEKTRPSFVYELALLITVLVWGVNFPVVKAALQVMHPFVFNALRFSLSVSLLGVLYLRQRSDATSGGGPVSAYKWRIIALGIGGHLAYQLVFILGIDRTTSGNAALIMTSSPLWVGLIAHYFKYEHLQKLAWIGLLVSLVGTIVIVLAGPEDIQFEGRTWLGNLLMVAAACSWGCYTAFSKPLLREISSPTLTFYTMLVALPGLWIASAPYWRDVEWSQVGLWVWGAILFSGALSTGLAYVIWNAAVRHVGATNTAAYGNLIPLVALTAGFLLLAEPVTVVQITGGVLIVTGILLMRRARVPVSRTQ